MRAVARVRVRGDAGSDRWRCLRLRVARHWARRAWWPCSGAPGRATVSSRTRTGRRSTRQRRRLRRRSVQTPGSSTSTRRRVPGRVRLGRRGRRSAAETCSKQLPGRHPGQRRRPVRHAAGDRDRPVRRLGLRRRRQQQPGREVRRLAAPIVSQFGTAGSAEGQFSGPQGIAVDPDRRVGLRRRRRQQPRREVRQHGQLRAYVRVRRREGQRSRRARAAARRAADDDGVRRSTRVAVDSTVVYVLDAGNGRIERFTSAGAFDQVFDPTDVFRPAGDRGRPGNDHLYVAQWAQDFSEQRVIEIDSTGTLVDTHGVGSTANNSSGLALSSRSAEDLSRRRVQRARLRPRRRHRPDGRDRPGGERHEHERVALGHGDAERRPERRLALRDVDRRRELDAGRRRPGRRQRQQPGPGHPGPDRPGAEHDLLRAARRDAAVQRADAISSEVQFTTDAVAPDVVTEPANDIAPSHATFQGDAERPPLADDLLLRVRHDARLRAAEPAAMRTQSAGAGNGHRSRDPAHQRPEPGTTYHYRIVATNQAGTVHRPGPDLHDHDAARRRARPRPGIPGAGFLPDDRGWELVSPPDKNGSDVMADTGRTRAAADGSAASFASLGGVRRRRRGPGSQSNT